MSKPKIWPAPMTYKGRMSEEEIERKVKEAEEFAEEDRRVKERIDARNGLESYLYNMRNQMDDKDKLGDKLDPDEKEKIEAVTKEALQWMDDSQNAEKEDYDEKLKEVESVCNRISTAVYQRSPPMMNCEKFLKLFKINYLELDNN